MRGVIAAIMALLGVILVLGGGASLLASALDRTRSGDSSTATSGGGGRFGRTAEVASRLPGADRLITWGVILLALSAVAAGAITFSATATAGTN